MTIRFAKSSSLVDSRVQIPFPSLFTMEEINEKLLGKLEALIAGYMIVGLFWISANLFNYAHRAENLQEIKYYKVDENNRIYDAEKLKTQEELCKYARN